MANEQKPTKGRAAAKRPSAAAKRSSAAPERPSATAEADACTITAFGREMCVGRVLLQCLLWFRLGKKEVLPGVLETYDAWLAAVERDSLQWWRRDDREEMASFHARAATQFRGWLAKTKSDSRGAVMLRLDPPEKDALRVLGHAAVRLLQVALHDRGSYLFSSQSSWLRLMVPPAEVEADPARWRDLVLQACERIPVTSGVAGHVLAEGDARSRNKAVDQAMDRVILERPGVDLQIDLARFMVKPTAVRTAGWLTVLGREATAKLGGQAKIRATLPSAVELHDTKHALVLQAGDYPQAHANHAYRAVGALVRPFQDPVLAALTPQGKAVMTRLA